MSKRFADYKARDASLRLLRALADLRKEIMRQVAAVSKTPEAIRGLRNLPILDKLVGSVDADRLEAFAKRFSIPGDLSCVNLTIGFFLIGIEISCIDFALVLIVEVAEVLELILCRLQHLAI
jgi:hypothetical protein